MFPARGSFGTPDFFAPSTTTVGSSVTVPKEYSWKNGRGLLTFLPGSSDGRGFTVSLHLRMRSLLLTHLIPVPAGYSDPERRKIQCCGKTEESIHGKENDRWSKEKNQNNLSLRVWRSGLFS
ncbi:hypothetical protein RvY_16324 [Ramazzottius varieornatus]|uniref:Uncharacterized protein n=1 Tax=Ramazzottius varieornatus TaxID=947166 RepID=A0A1D1VY23_RAMVA|nr:hypothetical protein RvY_16324 [Ramazzottius varieornatus]